MDTVCAWGAGGGLDPLRQQGDLQQQQLDCRSPVTFTAIGWLAGLQVVFRLHESFQSPIRELTVPPYELTEVGWGEFDIAVTVGAWGLHELGRRPGCVWSLTLAWPLQVHFSDDCMAPPLELVHKLKLYAEHDPTGQASTKKPVGACCMLLSCHASEEAVINARLSASWV